MDFYDFQSVTLCKGGKSKFIQRVQFINFSLEQLRIPELQHLCKESNLKISGKKSELIDRLLLMHNGNSSTHHGVAPVITSGQHVAGTYGVTAGVIIPPAVQAPPPPPPTSNPNRSKCMCNGTRSGECVTCPKCDHTFHRECVAYSTAPADKFLCPMCKVIHMDPFWPVVQVVMSCVMEGTGQRDRVITIETLSAMRRENKEVWCRAIAFMDNDDRKMQWPVRFNVEVNDKPVLQIKEPDKHHKRRDDAKALGPEMRSGENRIFIDYQCPERTKMLFVVMICSRATADMHFDHISAEQRVPYDAALSRVRGLLGDNERPTEDDDIECLDVSQSVKLQCPYTMSRIEVPARGAQCRHLQCFDLRGYLSLTERQQMNYRWKCPSCPATITPDTIVVDEFFERVLKDPSNEDKDDLNINPDGSFTEVKFVKQKGVAESDGPAASPVVAVPEKKEEALAIDDDDDDPPADLAKRQRLNEPFPAVAVPARPVANATQPQTHPMFQNHAAAMQQQQQYRASTAAYVPNPYSIPPVAARPAAPVGQPMPASTAEPEIIDLDDL